MRVMGGAGGGNPGNRVEGGGGEAGQLPRERGERTVN